MELQFITAKDFLSFRELNYNFLNGLPTLLLGENRTDEGQESNGSGKSAVSIIIEYAILHSTSKKVPDKELIFWGETNAEIKLSIHCPVRQQTLLIERKISIKDGGQSQLSINGVIKYAFDDRMVAEIDKFIISWIGISKEDLQNFFILSKFKYISFFDASNTQLIQLIGRFSNSSIVEGIDVDILKDVSSLEKERSLLFDSKNRLYGMIDVHKANLESELLIDKKDLVSKKLEEIDSKIIEIGEEVILVHTQNGIQNDKIVEYEDTLLQQLLSLQEANTKLSKLDSSGFEERYHSIDIETNKIKESRTSVEATLTSLQANYAYLSQMLRDIDLNIRGSVTCPKCSHKFVVGKEDVDISEEEKAKEETLSLIEKLNESLITVKENLNNFDIRVKDLRRDRITVEAEDNELQLLKRRLSNSIIELEKKKGEIELGINICNNNIKLNNTQLENLEKRSKELSLSKTTVSVDNFNNSEKVSSIRELIQLCESDILALEEKDREFNDDIFEKKQWSVTFKEFTQYLSVKTLKVLEGYANHFLASLKSDLRVELSGFKMKGDGTLSNKITAYIIRNGETHAFESFSGGERVRLECAMILTIQHAINSTSLNGGLQFLSIDEIFESTDSLGISILTNSLMTLGKTILLTTHIPGNNYECNILKVVKENRVSKILDI